MRRKRCIFLKVYHPDMLRYLYGRNNMGKGFCHKYQDGEVWIKPNNVNNNWFLGAVGRNKSFGIKAIPGFWDGENFKVFWPKEVLKYKT